MATQVAVVSNLDNQRIKEGDISPFRVSIEKADSVVLLINSDDATSLIGGSPSDFRVNMSSKIFDCRSLQITSIALPKIYNVNTGNNTIVTVHSDLGGTIVTSIITPGFFNPTNLANALVAQINSDWAAAGITDTITISFSALTRRFTFSSVNGEKFFFATDCTMYSRGTYLINLPSPGSSVLDPAIVGLTSWIGGLASLISSRYVTLHSRALNQFSNVDSISSTTYKINDLIGVFDLSQLYDNNDFDLGSAQNTKTFALLENKSNPILNMASHVRSTPTEIDIYIQDEYESNYLDLLPSGDFEYVGLTIYGKIMM